MNWKFATKAIHVGQPPHPTTGDTIPPIHLSTTYTQEGIGKHKGYEYSRAGNPTRTALEQCLASLENAEYGLAFASGCAASEAVTHLLQAGDHMVVSSEVYGGTYRLFELVLKRHELNFSWVKGTNPDDFAAAIRPETKMLWIETPTNPLVSIFDIAALADVAHRKQCLLTVDNTFATPYFQQPLSLGADVVVHSTTKYIGGHSDVIGGAVMCNDQGLLNRLYLTQKSIGAVPSPFDCWLVLRGLKTLALRMQQHDANAHKVAQWLANHKEVGKLYYPGLPEHPGHDTAKRQMTGFSGIVSCELKGGRPAVERVVPMLKVFSLAESLGGVESLCCYPVTMTHAAMPEDHRNEIGITDGLIRLSVGVEDIDDLLCDLEQAFDHA